MFLVKTSRRRGNLDEEEEVEGISSEAFQLSSTREGGVGEPHLLEPKGLGGFSIPWISG